MRRYILATVVCVTMAAACVGIGFDKPVFKWASDNGYVVHMASCSPDLDFDGEVGCSLMVRSSSQSMVVYGPVQLRCTREACK